jgi:hypothetical protein
MIWQKVCEKGPFFAHMQFTDRYFKAPCLSAPPESVLIHFTGSFVIRDERQQKTRWRLSI